MNITVRHALWTRGAEAEKVFLKELSKMIDKKVWRPVIVSALRNSDRSRIIRSQVFLKEKFLPKGEFEKLKARLVAGGDQQDKSLFDDLSSRTVSTAVLHDKLSTLATYLYVQKSIHAKLNSRFRNIQQPRPRLYVFLNCTA